MVKPIRNEPKLNVPSVESRAQVPYKSTTDKVTKAASGKVATLNSSKTGMKGHKVTQKNSSEGSLSSLVTKGSGKERALKASSVAIDTIGSFPKHPHANKVKIRTATIGTYTKKMADVSKNLIKPKG